MTLYIMVAAQLTVFAKYMQSEGYTLLNSTSSKCASRISATEVQHMRCGRKIHG
jgi:hypothetical protein